MIWRSILFLAGLALIVCQQSPVSPAVNGLESVVSGVATNALNGQDQVRGVKLKILSVTRAGLPVDFSSPIVRTGHQEVKHWVFDVVIRIGIIWKIPGQLTFDLGVGISSIVMGPQVITAQERVPPVETALNAQVNVGGPNLVPAHPFLEFAGRQVHAGWCVIAHGIAPNEPDSLKAGTQIGFKARDTHLHVDHVFGGQSWHAGRTDVMNGEHSSSQSATNSGGNHGELERPFWVV